MQRYIILDYDGTIHETMRIYKPAFLEAYTWLVSEGKAEQREFADWQISRWLGMNSKVMWNTFMPDLDQEYKDAASARIGAAMVSLVQKGTADFYPGAEEALLCLRSSGFRLLFLSNCKESYLDAHRSHFRLDRFFDGYYCCETYHFIPKQEIIPDIIREHPGEYLAAGDRFSDYEAAAAHKIPFIGCSYGYGTPEELSGADICVEDVSELPAAANFIIKQKKRNKIT